MEKRNRTTEPKLFNLLAIAQSTFDGKIVCTICGECLAARQMEIDHIVPNAGDEASNRMLLCPSCNKRKSNRQSGAELQEKLINENQIENLKAARLSRIKSAAIAQYAESPAGENDRDLQELIDNGTWVSAWKA